MLRLIRVLWHLFALAGIAGAVTLAWLALQGISARREPPALEKSVARRARAWLIPAAARGRTNPEPESPAALADARAHWADHCASCHGADGRGRTDMGRGLYPKAPDMVAAETQTMTDGELFYIIEHGVKLTGMPGWGNGTLEGERSSWHLVQLIRRLPRLTEDEVLEIESLMPLPPQEWQRREEERRFLEGEPVPPPPAQPHAHPPKPGS